jgi:hypothetical protein
VANRTGLTLRVAHYPAYWSGSSSAFLRRRPL